MAYPRFVARKPAALFSHQVFFGHRSACALHRPPATERLSGQVTRLHLSTKPVLFGKLELARLEVALGEGTTSISTDVHRPVMPRLRNAALVMLLVYVLGAFGYYLMGLYWLPVGQHWSLAECAYMTVISITTVGFTEIMDVSAVPGGWVYTSALIIGGAGVEVYAVSLLTTFLVEGHISEFGRLYRMKKPLRNIQNHLIVCGAGRMGAYVAKELCETGHQYVAIDTSANRVEALVTRGKEKGLVCAGLVGDATDEEVLKQARIDTARGLIVALPSDQDALFVVMTARTLNEALHIVTSAKEEKTVALMKRAGANRVVATRAVGGLRLASEAVRPQVVEFLDLMRKDTHHAIRFAEATILPGSKLDGAPLSRYRGGQKDPGVAVVCVQRPNQDEYHYGPAENFLLKTGDILILVGAASAVERVRKLAGI